jgi:2-polyprenyl-6-methoxyphenol hydroxylase-like FAD-dependent oxidoreductase
MRRITIIGAGQAGLHLGIGLVDAGYEVTLFSDRTPKAIL